MMCRLQMSPLRANMPRYSTVPAASLFATWQALMAWSSTRRRSIIRTCLCTVIALSLAARRYSLSMYDKRAWREPAQAKGRVMAAIPVAIVALRTCAWRVSAQPVARRWKTRACQSKDREDYYADAAFKESGGY